MRRAFAAGAAVCAAAVLAAPTASASAGSVTPAQVRTLQKQVKTLQKQVQALQLGQSVLLATVLCSNAATADAFQGTWTVLDQHQPTPLFGAQTPVTDLGACHALGVQRATLQAAATTLQAIVNLFKTP